MSVRALLLGETLNTEDDDDAIPSASTSVTSLVTPCTEQSAPLASLVVVLKRPIICHQDRTSSKSAWRPSEVA